MYKNLTELPDAVKALPEHGQEIFMAAFNSAFEQYKGDEEKCMATAWAAVKNKYEKKGDEWVKVWAKETSTVFAFKEISSDAPSEFQLLPEGIIEIEDDLPAFLDEEAADLILRYQAGRKKDIVCDYEHQTLKDVEAPASGWIKKLIYRGKGGLWAAVEWTEKAQNYIRAKEYRYFSPVMLIRLSDRKVIGIRQVALTNAPAINNLQPLIAKMIIAKDGEPDPHINEDGSFKNGFDGCVAHFIDCKGLEKDHAEALCAWIGRAAGKIAKFGKEEKIMLEKLRKLLGLAADAAEAKVEEAVQLLVNKVKSLETVVACKEILEAVGAKAEATKEEVIQIVASLKAPADVAKTLSLEVADLRKQLQEIKQTDLVQLALKDGKTSPEELDKWGRDLALKNPEQFKVIVLSRPAGSVIPIGGIPPEGPARDGNMNEVQKSINKMMGISDETWKKYNKTI